jgi:hypothetical protein
MYSNSKVTGEKGKGARSSRDPQDQAKESHDTFQENNHNGLKHRSSPLFIVSPQEIVFLSYRYWLGGMAFRSVTLSRWGSVVIKKSACSARPVAR